jgi:hypothetical protein
MNVDFDDERPQPATASAPAVMAPRDAVPLTVPATVGEPPTPPATPAATAPAPAPAPTSTSATAPPRPIAEPSGPAVTTPVVVCLVLAGLSLIATFSSPSSLLGVALFGGYAYYLYNGGRDITAVAADGNARARAWLVWGAVAGLAFVTGLTWAPALLVAVGAGGYAAYLFNGGRDVTREGAGGHRRSATWMYYAVIALVATALGFSHPASFLLALAAGAYATYLFRGGRWVIWIW